ncbi:MAG: hypothetical protein ACO1N7_00195 [Sphingobacteriaceae bacterium]
MKVQPLFFALLTCLILFGCGKEDNLTSDPSAKLELSADSIFFDTVFTTTGSITQRIRVFNRNKHAVKISEINLSGGSASNYQININGVATHRLEDIELRGNDSLNIFVKVTINPSSDLTPFIVKDSIGFLTNGNRQKVILTAYGQNAVFLKDTEINTNTVWENKLPYVVYNKVLVKPGVTLTIQKGTKVYFHKNASMAIAGSLKVAGTVNDSVTFCSDRLERLYSAEPGQWQGLYFLSSSNDNIINYALIKNGTIGIQVDSLSETSNPKLLLTNSMIHTMELVGLYGKNAGIDAFNNLITDCGRHLIFCASGGKYNFKQNTFSNLSFRFPRITPSVFFTDLQSPGKTLALNITLVNNIIWGNLQDELIVEKKGNAFLQLIRKNLIKSKDKTLEGLNNIINSDPLFKNPGQNSYLLSPASPAANYGEDLSSDFYFNSVLRTDLNGKTRLFPSDLGCYEIL